MAERPKKTRLTASSWPTFGCEHSMPKVPEKQAPIWQKFHNIVACCLSRVIKYDIHYALQLFIEHYND